LHQRAGDTGCLIPHLQELEKYGRVLPKGVIADSGYGSEENYAFLENNNVEAFIKYSTFDKEQTRAWKNQVGRIENMEYDEDLDEWICAAGKRLIFQYENKKKTENGYISHKRNYRCVDCKGCPFQESCAKGKETKKIQVSMQNQEQRKEIRERLSTEHGDKLYRKRKSDVESVYGQIKHNRQFRRFYLRGLSKTKVEWGLICIAHNLCKWASKINQNEENYQVG